MPLGLYLSVPFCRSKCTYCNFASGVNSPSIFDRYIDRVGLDLENAEHFVSQAGGTFDCKLDSIYFGGGTPTILEIAQIERLFVTISQNFEVAREAEITVECAPGTLSDRTLGCLQRFGVNRISLGVQSFVDREASAIARLHNRATVLNDIKRLCSAGLANINIDLIAGLPHQTTESWHDSLSETLGTEAPHVSVYMLEVDEDSRLGQELMAGGTKYHAHFVPDDDLIADLYEMACERLSNAGIEQYEISNFVRPGLESKHNLKYWTRKPYLGFGLDAHSMLSAGQTQSEAIRFWTPDILDAYISGDPTRMVPVSQTSAIEEHFFLGLRLNRGVDLEDLETRFGPYSIAPFLPSIRELTESGLLRRERNVIRLTPRGRLLSNEVFQRFVSPAEALRAEPALAQCTGL
jgi:oxygen-independent coproporphyrinogen III oxidase